MPETTLAGRTAATPFAAFPLAVEHAASGGAALWLLVPSIATMLAPLALLAACDRPVLTTALTSAAENPVAALQALSGIALWSGLCVVPVKRLLQRWRGAQSVGIDGGVVRVREQGLLGCHSWELPLAEFSGIAHVVRSSLSGVRHELYLVHPERTKSVLIHRADRIAPATVAGAGALLGLPVVPAGQLYRFFARARSPRPSTSPLGGAERAARGFAGRLESAIVLARALAIQPRFGARLRAGAGPADGDSP